MCETRNYEHLKVEERAVIEVMRSQGHGVRAISRQLGRSASSISRELKKNEVGMLGPKTYRAKHAQAKAERHRCKVRRTKKLAYDSRLFWQVVHPLRACWSPQQIARRMRQMHPHEPNKRVSHETIYTALYAMPKGSLRKELIACLRRKHAVRKPQNRGIRPGQGKLQDMVSIHVRPPEIEDKLIPGHWEGDLIKGGKNRSSVGTLVERTTRFVLLAKMQDATASSALKAFTEQLNRMHPAMRKTLTYDQGSEMAKHKTLTERTGMQVYFADPHSPWQKGAIENTNGLLRQFLPKGTDLSVYSQTELDDIAFLLNTRPRQSLDFKMPIEAYAQSHHDPDFIQFFKNHPRFPEIQKITPVALES
jgi:transposase, IS30 family